MSEQREVIAEVIHDAWNLSGVPYERGNIFKKDKRRSQADAVISHLWERADDPEVVEAALDAAEAANDLYPLDGEPNSVWEARYFSAAFGAFLEQLIGPRPSGEEE